MTADTPTGAWELKLYIAGMTPRSQLAVKNLQCICAEHLVGDIDIEVVDLLQHPERAKEDQIVALPTLVRVSPSPVRKLIGDLSDTEKVLAGLDIVEMACTSL
jgi:circadian clock protein KaiB